jgi:hypothetical protein
MSKEYDEYDGPFIAGLSPTDESTNPLHPENEIDVRIAEEDQRELEGDGGSEESKKPEVRSVPHGVAREEHRGDL